MKEGDAHWGKRPEREGHIEELVGGQNPGPEAPPKSRKDERGGSKGNAREGAIARRVMEKGGYVRVMEGEKVRGYDPVEYFLPRWSRKYLLSPRRGDGN